MHVEAQTIEDMRYGPEGKRGQAAYVNRASRFGFDSVGAVRRVPDVERAVRRVCRAVAAVPGRGDTIEQVHATRDGRHQVRRKTDSHKITRSLARQFGRGKYCRLLSDRRAQPGRQYAQQRQRGDHRRLRFAAANAAQ